MLMLIVSFPHRGRIRWLVRRLCFLPDSIDVSVVPDPSARKKTRPTLVTSLRHSFAPSARRLADALRPGSRPVVPK